ncbi:hypothetical protein S83_066907 [Arachis hypogaea]
MVLLLRIEFFVLCFFFPFFFLLFCPFLFFQEPSKLFVTHPVTHSIEHSKIVVGCSRLEHLNLKWCFEISDLCVDLLCKKCFYLKVLDVSYVKLSQFHIIAPCVDW